MCRRLDFFFFFYCFCTWERLNVLFFMPWTITRGNFRQNVFVNCILSLSNHRSPSDGTIVATRLTFCPCPVTLLWVALSIYFHFIKLTQLGVSANTTSVMAAHWTPVLESLTKHHLISALAYSAHPVCPLSLLRTSPAHQSSLVL